MTKPHTARAGGTVYLQHIISQPFPAIANVAVAQGPIDLN